MPAPFNNTKPFPNSWPPGIPRVSWDTVFGKCQIKCFFYCGKRYFRILSVYCIINGIDLAALKNIICRIIIFDFSFGCKFQRCIINIMVNFYICEILNWILYYILMVQSIRVLYFTPPSCWENSCITFFILSKPHFTNRSDW